MEAENTQFVCSLAELDTKQSFSNLVLHSPERLVLVEAIITFCTISSIQKRRAALYNTLKQIEGKCIGVVSKRIKSVKIFLDRPPDTVVEALLSSSRIPLDDLGNLRASKKNIILKQDGSLYLGDNYLYQTTERYLELRSSRNLRRLAMLKYSELTNSLVETNGTLDQNIGKTKYQGNKRVPHIKRKNHVCKICRNTHQGYKKYCCKRLNDPEILTATVVIDANYCNPDISGRSVNKLKVFDDKGVKSTVKHPFFSDFQTRLSTFKHWRRYPDPRSLSENGFFYRGVGDTTICYSCGVALMGWDQDDDALLEHLCYSPGCKHLENSLGRKTIQEYLINNNDMPLERGFDNDALHVESLRVNLQQEETSETHKVVYQEDKRFQRSARSPWYQSINARLSTFGKFPNYCGISIKDVAHAGFYYTGVNDLVRCYWCDVGLKDWESGDDPFWEHAKYQSDCDHLRNIKGEHFIAHIQETCHHNSQRSIITRPREPIGAGQEETKWKNGQEELQKWISNSEDQPSGTKRASTNLLDMPAAQSVLQYGYSDEIVLAAIRTLNIKDDTKLTAMQILDVVLDAEDKGIDLAQKSTGQEPQMYQIEKTQNLNGDYKGLLADNQRLKSLMLCKHCQARERNILFLPCTHLSLCHECANETSMCPECWKPIKDKVRTYMA